MHVAGFPLRSKGCLKVSFALRSRGWLEARTELLHACGRLCLALQGLV